MAALSPTSGIIMEDGVYIVKVGAAWTGAAPDFTGSDVVTMDGILKEATLNQKLSKTRVNGKGAVKNRYHSAEDELTIKSFVPLGGAVVGADGIARGKWIWFSHTTLNTASAAIVVQGVVTDFKLTISQGEAVYEDLTIDLNPDHA